MLAPTERPRRWFTIAVVAIFVLASAWRAVMAAALPVISRDGVLFCWYARDLGQQGFAFLRTPDAQQHPLFPVLILATHKVARTLGAPDGPLTWQRSGQLVCWLAGLAVVALSGLLARRLVRRLQLPLDERVTMLVAMLMAAALDLNVWLSADVMSDQVHLALYLAAVWLLLKLNRLPAVLLCGVLAGLAFLTREEGLMPAVGGCAVLLAQRKRFGLRRTAGRGLVLLAGFLVCAGPYWAAVGRFSTKKDPVQWLREEAAAADVQPGPDAPTADAPGTAIPMLARLEIVELHWYQVVPFALYKLLRAGRVVLILLALLPLLNVRRRLLDPVLIGFTTCLAGHFVLTLGLASHYGYLSPRHMLVIVMLLAPLAAMLLGRVVHLAWANRRPASGVLAILVCLAPLLAYALRVPNSKDAFLAGAARWLVQYDPEHETKRLLGGTSTRRIAFYADMAWEHWPETPADYDGLRDQLRGLAPGYFAIEVAGEAGQGDQKEREGNRELVTHLEDDAELGATLVRVLQQPGPDGSELWLFEVAPAGPGPAEDRTPS